MRVDQWFINAGDTFASKSRANIDSGIVFTKANLLIEKVANSNPRSAGQMGFLNYCYYISCTVTSCVIAVHVTDD